MPAPRPNAMPPTLPAPLDDNARLVEMIARITNTPAAHVRDRLYREQLRVGTSVSEEMLRRKIPFHVPSPELDAFYGDTDAFMYELIVWNRNPHKQAMRAWIADHLAREAKFPLDVLFFGDGLGFDSVHLALAGHNVTYFEVSARSQQFAREVFQIAGKPFHFGEPKAEAFDVVVCLDVLEHVPDPPGLVKHLAGCLRPGGLLVVSAPFFLVNADFPTHLNANRKYSGRLKPLTGPAGLDLYDGHPFWNPLILKKTVAGQPVGGAGFLRRLQLHLMGLLYRLAGWWPAPLAWLVSLSRPVERRWLQGLEPGAEV